MDEAHKKAMQKGRERVNREKRKEAVKRVEAWTKWLKAGSDLKKIPEVPTDADYRIYRQVKGIR
jgi:hypothetical protein